MALSHCDLSMLMAHDLVNAMRDFPESAAKVRARAVNRLNELQVGSNAGLAPGHTYCRDSEATMQQGELNPMKMMCIEIWHALILWTSTLGRRTQIRKPNLCFSNFSCTLVGETGTYLHHSHVCMKHSHCRSSPAITVS